MTPARCCCRIVCLALLFPVLTLAQSLPSYYARHPFLMAPASSFEDGLMGFANPANLAMLPGAETRFYWSTDGTKLNSFNDWVFLLGGPHFGFGAFRQHGPGFKLNEYRFMTAGGNRTATMGLSYSWTTGDQPSAAREQLFSISTIARPSRYVSIGLMGSFSFSTSERESVVELGIRPRGDSKLTIFGDAALQGKDRPADALWSAGAAVEVLSGVKLVGRYFDSQAFSLGMSVNFGRPAIAGQAYFDVDQNHATNTFMVRSGALRPSLLTTAGKQRVYVPMVLKGRVDYQRYTWFDKSTRRFFEILQDLRAAANDPRVAVIALNFSGMQVLPEHAWEIRTELQNAQRAGKKIISFIDNASLSAYHLASVSDWLVMDPEGSMTVQGFVLGKTYFKGTLAKLGLGFDEWRFFKYKSAAEALSRDNMSDADREQLQAYVDDWYELVKTEVCASRRLSAEEFDRIIDDEIFLSSDRAREVGLVDTLARWSEAKDLIRAFSRRPLSRITAGNLLDNALARDAWSESPKIAVVYALGICAMDEGIKARRLEKVIRRLASDAQIKALVFRVDSPGGDGLASDVVAAALKKCSEHKPVIVSQGQVAASGGYWISMYGDTIVAGPNTITGSIGVIGGWIYDQGLSQMLGMTSDFVKRGEHADLGFGVRLPLLGATIPARNLTEQERAKVEWYIKKFYDDFVGKVAAGREMQVARVRDVAEGRVFSGTSGKREGLVDEVGGLMTAIAIAKQRAGFSPDDHVEYFEYPRSKGLFNLGTPEVARAIDANQEPVIQIIKLMTEFNGKPLPLLLPGAYPVIE